MNFNVRGAVINNIHNMDNQELQGLIEDSIGGEEKILPGLGVLFEVIWKNSSLENRNVMIDTLHDKLSQIQ
ncbi:small acid-soluble spore protein SspI [Hazenella sp. IB182357]|uniref:Small, acid-soluble spore protein I n=1 Tax=Polycladospora coralii TaxID=2771432 RepID=A0A926N9S4_9BACL|nr:small acid-soluble spore protein SspI [Polycladospora coralii]MBD1372816.1 small acid-soluble spore protein SspI [Polycladospora coralii]MBS7529486.1 small acid-soluble spore protein SspI [Polycladospora coralii]